MLTQPRDVGATANYLAGPLQPFLAREDVTEVIVNRPREVLIEGKDGWESHDVPAMDFRQCQALAVAVGGFVHQDVTPESPLLEADLPTGERVQFVLPPAVPRDTVSITIRKPSLQEPTLDALAASGLFKRVVLQPQGLLDHDAKLLALKAAGRIDEFLRMAVLLRKTIVVSGHTGAGKTHILKALCREIAPHERIITIESVPELLLRGRQNKVHLFYSGTEKGLAKVAPRHLLRAALRMRPDRIILAEVRDEECFFFVRAAASGHPGSMTTMHAGSCYEALKQMALMIRQGPGGAGLPLQDIEDLLTMTVDVVVQFGNDPSLGRYVSEVYFDPQRKLDLVRGMAR